MNWILSWNEWITQFLNRYLPFLMISPLFCLFWTLFGQFLGTFPIRPVLIIPWLLNWIIFWIESPEFILNWIIFWIESWVKQYWIEYWMNHFFVKFKHWIESESLMLRKTAQLVSCFVPTGEGNGNLLPWYISLGSGLARNHVLCWQDLWQHDNITRWLFGMCKELEWWWHLGARAIRPFSTSLWLFTLEQIYTFLYFETFYLTKNWYQ